MKIKNFKDFNESEINENKAEFGSPYYFGYTEVTKIDLSKMECGLVIKSEPVDKIDYLDIWIE